MSHQEFTQLHSKDQPAEGGFFWKLLLLAALLGFPLAALLSSSSAGPLLARLATRLLALDQIQVTWYITRSAGWIGYLLLWLSTAWGLALPSRIFDRLLPRSLSYDFHEFISLLALGFTGLHIAVLAFDQFTPFSIAQILVPFISSYRPLWTGVGVLALYLMLLVTATFYLRKRIGVKAFRVIHILSLAGFFGAGLHGLLAGSDSALSVARLLYAGTFLSVIFLLAYWLAVSLLYPSQGKALSETKPLPVINRR